jgi:hypothetical protein
MGYRQFFDAFFELADVWCPDIDGAQYAHFLDTLRLRLSVMVVQKKDGSIVRKLVRRRRRACSWRLSLDVHSVCCRGVRRASPRLSASLVCRSTCSA